MLKYKCIYWLYYYWHFSQNTELREKSGMFHAETAKLLGCSQQACSRYESHATEICRQNHILSIKVKRKAAQHHAAPLKNVINCQSNFGLFPSKQVIASSSVFWYKLDEPLAMWDTLTLQDKHDVAAEMIKVVYISHNSGDIEIKFGVWKHRKTGVL